MALSLQLLKFCLCLSCFLLLMIQSVYVLSSLRTFFSVFSFFSICLVAFINLSLSPTHLISVSLSISFALWFPISIIIIFFVSLSTSVPFYFGRCSSELLSFIFSSISLNSCRSFIFNSLTKLSVYARLWFYSLLFCSFHSLCLHLCPCLSTLSFSLYSFSFTLSLFICPVCLSFLSLQN